MIVNRGRNGRTFVHSTRTGDKFRRLFSVTITHNYYTRQDGLCPDFRIVPTARTQSIMGSLGLVLKTEEAGFSVFFLPNRLGGILSYLRDHAQGPDGKTGFWSRLTFLMELANPAFVGITALPIKTTLAEVTLYGCNLEAHAGSEAVILPEGKFMGARALYPRISDEVTLALPAAAHRVTVTDISGAVVIPPPHTKPLKIYKAGGSKYVLIDFGSEAHDLYTINVYDDARKRIDRKTYSYVPPGTGTAGLLDMLFTQPTRSTKQGIYPIPPIFDSDPKPEDAGEIAYRLPFDSRRTYWKYYVVSQVPGKLTELKIEGPGAKFERQIEPERLPDGSLATLFTTDTPLPLRQKSTQRFELSGVRRDPNGNDNEIRALRLPVAPAAPVWPAPGSKPTAITGTSEMFVYV